jgi:hypothetical protein
MAKQVEHTNINAVPIKVEIPKLEVTFANKHGASVGMQIYTGICIDQCTQRDANRLWAVQTQDKSSCV